MSLSLNNAILSVALLLGFSVSGCRSEKDAGDTSLPSDLPNIVLIVADDHGNGDLGCYGNNAVKTPNLDYLASEGIRFTRAHCTSASCSASRSVILTGVYNHANGHCGPQHLYHHFSACVHVYSLPG